MHKTAKDCISVQLCMPKSFVMTRQSSTLTLQSFIVFTDKNIGSGVEKVNMVGFFSCFFSSSSHLIEFKLHLIFMCMDMMQKMLCEVGMHLRETN